jgi:hypothetical protein
MSTCFNAGLPVRELPAFYTHEVVDWWSKVVAPSAAFNP